MASSFVFEVARLWDARSREQDRSLWLVFRKCGPFGGASHGVIASLIINDVTPPLKMNIPGGQKLFIIRGENLLKGFGRAAFKFRLKSIKTK